MSDTEKHIHIVSLDVPIPPDYGAMIDVYNRCKALTSAGYLVHLHCYEYGRGRAHDIQGIAHEIHYYDRPKGFKHVLHYEPFIVRTRRSKELLKRLSEDRYPILWEGQHCLAFLKHPELGKRTELVRIHNIEWQYYHRLAFRKGKLKDRFFFLTESWKLFWYDRRLKQAEGLICVSDEDVKYYRKFHPNVTLIRSGFPLNFTQKAPDAEDYCLFHGNLSVAENEEAVLWILETFQTHAINRKLIIAGKNPSEKLQNAVLETQQAQLIENPSNEQMDFLIQNAADHLLITFQASGLKLKLLISSATSGRCIATPELVVGSGLAAGCEFVQTQDELAAQIAIPVPANPEKINVRHTILKESFDVKSSALKLGTLLFPNNINKTNEGA